MSVWESVGRTHLKENERHQMLQESVSHVSSDGERTQPGLVQENPSQCQAERGSATGTWKSLQDAGKSLVRPYRT